MSTVYCNSCGVKTDSDHNICQICEATILDNWVGQVLENKYIIEAKIGQGSKSNIYKAKNLHTNTTVAIKIIHAHLVNKTVVDRFRHEARIASGISHANVVKILDFGSVDNILFTVTELLNGISLQILLKKQNYLPVDTTVKIVKQICAALAVAHSQGIIHQDLKPKNIIIHQSENNELFVKVINFCLSKIIDQKEGNLDPLETLPSSVYMSPEQAQGLELSHLTDIYNLGLICYEMLSGVTPFQGKNQEMIKLMHIFKLPQILRELRPEIPPELDLLVVSRMLAKNPLDRPQQTAQLAIDLTAISQGLAIPVIPEIPIITTIAPHLMPKETISITTACIVCQRRFSELRDFCPFDGHHLVAASFKVDSLDPLFGQVIDEKYVIDAKIEEDSNNTVYKAKTLHTNVIVAIKIIHAHLVSDRTCVERFQRQANIASKLNHPNAIQVLGFGVTDETIAYIVSEFVQGISLRALLQKQNRLPVDTTIRIVKQICVALAVAHSQGIIHQDLKPENIIICDYEQVTEIVKVADFCLSKFYEMSIKENYYAPAPGTPAYMSPEKAQKLELTYLTDIYSLGIICYEMLAGVTPFHNTKTTQAIQMRHIHSLPQPLRELRPELSPELDLLVSQMLAKNPTNRPQQAAQLGIDLATI